MDQHLNTGDPSLDDEDDESVEYDENGHPTAAQIQRWEALDAAAANQWLMQVRAVIAEVNRDYAADIAAGRDPGPHLITVDELRAAGALDVPAAWRKSLGGGPRRQFDLFAGPPGDDDANTKIRQPDPQEENGEQPADELP